MTSYLDDHPGGSDSILQNSGVDCTDEFMGVHSQVSHRGAVPSIGGEVQASATSCWFLLCHGMLACLLSELHTCLAS